MQQYQLTQEIVIKALLEMKNISEVFPILKRTCSSRARHDGIIPDTLFNLDTFEDVLCDNGYELTHLNGFDVGFFGIFQATRTQNGERRVESYVNVLGLKFRGSKRKGLTPDEYAISEYEFVFNFPLRLGDPVPEAPNTLKQYQNLPLVMSSSLPSVLSSTIEADA